MNENKIEIKIYVNTDINIPPQHYGYKGGFANITKCSDCGRTGLYYDQYPADCCPNCGGKIIESISGKWDADKKYWLLRGENDKDRTHEENSI